MLDDVEPKRIILGQIREWVLAAVKPSLGDAMIAERCFGKALRAFAKAPAAQSIAIQCDDGRA